MAAKQYTLADIKKHNTPKDLWLVIEDKIYDLTKFRNEHPGGEEALDEVAGRDGTKEFIEVGHSSEAREIMAKYYIGDVAASDRKGCKIPVREIAIAVGAVIIGIAVVFIIRKTLAKH